MDKETENLLDTIAQKAASDAVAKIRKFHQDDLKVLSERIDIGFGKVENEFKEVYTRLDRVDSRLDGVESRLGGVENRLDGVQSELKETNTRLDRVENALATLLHEFKMHQEKQRQLEVQVAELTERVNMLEKQLAHR